MKLKSHFYLGICLLQQDSSYPSSAKAIAFLVGCAEPDLNAFTYLKGSLHGQRFRGHNYPNLLPRIERLLCRLQQANASGVLYYYRLGKLSHYLADAFTFPHNSSFSGTLREHMRYEDFLEERFLSAIRIGNQKSEAKLENDSLLPNVLYTHDAYLDAPMDVEKDVGYIIAVTSTVFSSLEKSAVHTVQPVCA